MAWVPRSHDPCTPWVSTQLWCPTALDPTHPGCPTTQCTPWRGRPHLTHPMQPVAWAAVPDPAALSCALWPPSEGCLKGMSWGCGQELWAQLPPAPAGPSSSRDVLPCICLVLTPCLHSSHFSPSLLCAQLAFAALGLGRGGCVQQAPRSAPPKSPLIQVGGVGLLAAPCTAYLTVRGTGSWETRKEQGLDQSCEGKCLCRVGEAMKESLTPLEVDFSLLLRGRTAQPGRCLPSQRPPALGGGISHWGGISQAGSPKLLCPCLQSCLLGRVGKEGAQKWV